MKPTFTKTCFSLPTPVGENTFMHPLKSNGLNEGSFIESPSLDLDMMEDEEENLRTVADSTTSSYSSLAFGEGEDVLWRSQVGCHLK